MSSRDSLYTVVHTLFHEAFGQPHAMEGGGQQWTLRPKPQYSCEIHVLLNGTAEQPGVWIFDPYDPKNGVENTPIVESRQIGELITLIQGRLNLANQVGKFLPPPPARET